MYPWFDEQHGRRRLSDRIIQHGGRNDFCMHTVSRGALRRRDHTDSLNMRRRVYRNCRNLLCRRGNVGDARVMCRRPL